MPLLVQTPSPAPLGSPDGSGAVAALAAPLSARQLWIPGGLTFERGAAGEIGGV